MCVSLDNLKQSVQCWEIISESIIQVEKELQKHKEYNVASASERDSYVHSKWDRGSWNYLNVLSVSS